MDTTETPDLLQRTKPDVSDGTTALIEKWATRIKNAKQFWSPVFDKIREEQRFAAGQQWPDQSREDDRYIANFIQRSVNQKTASIYAKNPKAVVRRKPKMDFTVWDGDRAKLEQARQVAAMSPMGPPPEVAAILSDYDHGMQIKGMFDRVARTLEVVYQHEFEQQLPNIKRQMKSLVRRAVTSRVGYVKLAYQREDTATGLRATTDPQMNTRDRMQAIAAKAADIADGKEQEDSPLMVEMVAMAEALKSDAVTGQAQVSKEGLVIDFPKARNVIVDPACTSLDGFICADWVAEEFILTPEKVAEKYGIEVGGGGAVQYSRSGKPSGDSYFSLDDKGKDETTVCLWEVYDRVTGLRCVICDGYTDFLEPFEAPDPNLERFYPWFALVFNALEIEENEPKDDVSIYPQSEVRLLMPLQLEVNRCRQSLREHRQRNRPKWGVAAGRLEQEDKENLKINTLNAVIELKSLQPGERISDMIQAIPGAPIDPSMYDTSAVHMDMLLVAGQQEANLGATSGATATETNIAETSRLTSTGSNVDDLDDFLTDIARSAGEILLMQMSREMAMSIAGQGGAWPDMDRESIKKELYLEVQAASSGRPNQNMEAARFERLAPLLMQIPGISPDFMAREAIKRLDDRLDLEDAYQSGAPAIQQPPMPPGMAGGVQPGVSPNSQQQFVQSPVSQQP